MERKIRTGISRRTRAALGGFLGAAALGAAAVAPQQAEGADFTRTDLDFILTQIGIAEQHAAGQSLFRVRVEHDPGPDRRL